MKSLCLIVSSVAVLFIKEGNAECTPCDPGQLAFDCPPPEDGYYYLCQKMFYEPTFCCVQNKDPFIPCVSNEYCSGVAFCRPGYHTACTFVPDIMPRGAYCVCALDNPPESWKTGVSPSVQSRALTVASSSRTNLRYRSEWADCIKCNPHKGNIDCSSLSACVYDDSRYMFCCE